MALASAASRALQPQPEVELLADVRRVAEAAVDDAADAARALEIAAARHALNFR